MTRTLAKDLLNAVGQEKTVMGWVNARRDHGGVIFIDLRDESGIVQLTLHPDQKEAFGIGEQVRDEFVLKAVGSITERDESLKNPNIITGSIELVVSQLTILNKSEPLPLQIDGDQNIQENTRLKYRYLDLRRSKMQTMLKARAKFNKFIRDYMEERDFTEVTTPILANSSPEGARDFLIPSRYHEGAFYALPQAPQQFKQLLMVGGVPRYYQIAACFRDEDPRADRLYGEFYQLDLEMSFVTDGSEVRETMSPLVIDLVKKFAGKEITNLESDGSVPNLSYQDAMDMYGTDKPDLRFDMKLVDLGQELKNCSFGVFSSVLKSGGSVKAICVKDGASLSRSQIDKFTDIAKSEGAGGLAYMTIVDGEVKSPIAKFFESDELDAIVQKTDASTGDAIFFGSDTKAKVNKVLGRLRNEFADHFNLKDDSKVALAWVVDFPFYEVDEKTGALDFGHNPFSMPKGGLDAIRSEDKQEVLADQYDMVMNGYEICSGAVRNYAPDVMYEAFAVVGYDKQHVDQRFGAMINAFKYGAPPHAGCAFGLDRIFMILMNETNIREIVAFPKNGSGVDVMMNSPSQIDTNQLKELNLSTLN